MLSATAHDTAHQQLVDDFHAWQAPWLLNLPHLTPEMRHTLEQQAREQAPLVKKLHRLYPGVADPGTLQAALVEAVMLSVHDSGAPTRDNTLSPYYIELNTTGTDWERGK